MLQAESGINDSAFCLTPQILSFYLKIARTGTEVLLNDFNVHFS
jgi:hypothetical protein